MIIEVESDQGCFARFQIPPTTTRDQIRVRLLDVSVPDPPLLASYAAAITTDIDSFDTPPVRNMLELVDFFDSLVDSVSGARLLEGYWDGVSIELMAMHKNVNLSADFRAVLKMPATLNLFALAYASLNIASFDISAGYAVELKIGEAEGFYKNGYTNIAAVFPRGASKPTFDHWLTAREPLTSGTIRVASRRRSDGVLEEIVVIPGERWSARIEVEVTQRAINPIRTI